MSSADKDQLYIELQTNHCDVTNGGLMESKKQSRKDLSKMNNYEYGHPACEIIETEMGVVPESCEGGDLPKSIQQSKQDREQNYDLDGVSMSSSGVLVASARA